MSFSEQIDQLGEEIGGRIDRAIRELREAVRRRLEEGQQDLLRQLDEIGPESAAQLVSGDDLAPLVEGAGAEGRAGAFADLVAGFAALDRGRTQAEVLNALLAEAGRHASRSALFLTRAEGAQVWGSHGWGDAEAALAGLTLDYADAWGRLAAGTGTVVLRTADCAALCSRIESPLPAEGVLVPLVVRDRVAAALYADRGDDDGPLTIAALQALTHVAALVIESLPFRSRTGTPTLRRYGGEGAEGPGLPLWDAEAVAAPAAEEAPAAEAAPAAEEVAVEAEEPPAVAEPEEAPEPEAVAEPEPVAEPEAAAPPAEEAPEELAAGIADLGEVELDDFAAPSWEREEPAESETAAIEAPETPEPEPWGSAAESDEEAGAEPEPPAAALWGVRDLGETAEPEPEPWRPEPPTEEPWRYEPIEEEPVRPEQAEAEAAPTVEPEEIPGEPAPELSEIEAVELPPPLPELEPEPEAEPQPEPEPEAESEPWGVRAVEPSTAEVARDTVLLDRSQLPGEPAGPAPLAEAPGTAAGGPGSTQVMPPADVEGPGWAFSTTQIPTGGDEARHEEARRLARLLVSEIRLYNEDQVEEGRRNHDLYDRLRDDIERSRQMYEERIDDQVRESTDYFQQELVRILGGGDAGTLGR